MRDSGIIEPSFKQVRKAFMPEPLQKPDPGERELVSVNPKTGTTKVSQSKMAEYLRDCGFRSVDDSRIVEFDGRFYNTVKKPLLYDAIINATHVEGGVSPNLTRNFMEDVITYWKTISKPGCAEGENTLSTYDLETRYSGWIIPFENGLYNVRDDELLPFTPDLLFETYIHADYIPDEDCREIEEVYEGIFKDPEVREFFYLAVGYTLYSPTLTPPAIFLLLGPGKTGKSAILNTLQELLGDENVANLSLVKLSSQFGLSRLKGLSANLCDEAGRKNGVYTQVDSDLLKAISAGRPWEVEQKFKDVEQYHNMAKLWFAANSMPDFGDSSSGMMRRIFAFPCVVEQKDSNQIYRPMKSEKGKAWLAFKALRAFLKFRWEGQMEFNPPEVMERAVSDYAVLDSVSEYILDVTKANGLNDKETIRDYFNDMPVSEAYTGYSTWAVDNGYSNRVKSGTFKSRIVMDFNMTRYVKNVYLDSGKTSNTFFIKPEELEAREEKKKLRMNNIKKDKTEEQI